MLHPELNGLDRHAVAERIRALLSGTDSLASAAERLDVPSNVLAMAIDDTVPYPTLELLDAIIRVFGVDPAWLVTGRYDSATHRRALEDEDGDAERALRDVLRTRSTPTSIPIVVEREPGR
ncbi:MAG TPA: hypothetical protein VF159_09305 [Gemmatimonadaceae bacterium]